MKRIALSSIGFVLALAPQLALAKLACYPLAQIERTLDSDYGEIRHFSGRETAGIEYRLYINAKTGSWSWVGIPAGTQVGCLIFAGSADDAMPRAESAPAAPPRAQF